MPLVKVKGGWKWGSQGPFPTKAKALAVARAAYARGYKEHDARDNKYADRKNLRVDEKPDFIRRDVK